MTELLPVVPDPPADWGELYAVSWIAPDGGTRTCLVGAKSSKEAARSIAYSVDLRPRSRIDARECGAASTYLPVLEL